MTVLRTLLPICLASLFAATAPTTAQADVSVTTGAGYIPLVKQVVSACRADVQGNITESYGGNLGQMLAQVSSGSGVNVVITDAATLDVLRTPVKFSLRERLGDTPLMLVWRKGLDLKRPEDLARDDVKRIVHPDVRAAVYGRAGAEWIKSRDETFRATIEPRLMQVAGVPQVISFVLRAEADAGFVNRLAANKNRAELGGMMEIKDGYTPITMTAAVVDGAENDPAVRSFLGCLESQKVSGILEKAGIRR